MASLPLAMQAASAGGYVIGSTSAANAGQTNFCLTSDDPASSAAVWSCQTRTPSGGIAWVNGVVGNASTVQAANLAGNAPGANALAIGTPTTSAQTPDSTAIGSGAQVLLGTATRSGNAGLGSSSIALGTGAIAGVVDGGTTYGTANAVAIGANARAETDGAAAFGAGAQALGAGAVALGANSSATAAGGVAIGEGSVANTAAGAKGYTPIGTPAGAQSAVDATTSTRGAVAVGDPSKGLYRQVTGVAAGTADSDAVNVAQLKSVSADVSNLADRAVTYDGALGSAKDKITLAGTSGTTLANLKAGAVSAGSMEAINGAQLYGASQSVAGALGGGAGVDANGKVTAPSYTIGGSSYSNVGDALGAVNGGLSSLTTQVASVNTQISSISTQITSITNGGGIKYFHTSSAGGDSQATGAESLAMGGGALASGTGALAGGADAQATAEGATALGRGAVAGNAGDVALGAGSMTLAAVQTSTMTVNGQTYAVAGTAASTVSVGSAGAERTITNVAAGRVEATSTDAVNGSQLYATNKALEATASSIGALGKNALQYDTDLGGNKRNSVTLQGGDPNAPVVISNVAAGVGGTDAVNVAQLKTGLGDTLKSATSYADERSAYAIQTANTYTDQKASQTLQQANSYTDRKFAMLNESIGDVRSEARQAAAIGLAAGSLRYDDRPGKISAAIGGGAWGGQGAAAAGLGYTSDDQRVRANISGTNAGGNWGFGGGVSFTLN
ncbi:YadA-like family protein [Xanthobacter sp. KR7-225]|uniref:YadA-like family protein n=1 Tax=Xanthobacter sp. KR7-225 TaxID=3156613 RepID=UPI0032B5C013